LLAGDAELIEAMLGKTIPAAREEFDAFAKQPAHGNPEYPPLKISQHYAKLENL
jgi:hypothetical protein